MGNGNSNSGSNSGNKSGGLQNDFNVCVARNTLNGNGFMGAQGDVATLKCIAERVADRATENYNKSGQNDAYHRSSAHSEVTARRNRNSKR